MPSWTVFACRNQSQNPMNQSQNPIKRITEPAGINHRTRSGPGSQSQNPMRFSANQSRNPILSDEG